MSSSCRKEVDSENSLLTSEAQLGALVIQSHEIINDDSYNYNPCTGEWIQFRGEAQLIIDIRINNNHVSGTYHFNILHQETGVGATTGTVYHAVGGVVNQPFSGSLINGSFTGTVVYHVLMQAQGKTDNFEVTENLKLTINANGEVTVDRDALTMKCKG